MFKYIKIFMVLIIGMFFLMGDYPNIGCSPPPSNGYLIDSPLEGVDYYCDNEKKASKTGSSGRFSCDIDTSVLFKIGKLEIGEIEEFKDAMRVYPQDLVGISREDFTDERLVLMARFLQSLDDDGNISRSINITQEVKDSFEISQFSDMSISDVEKVLLKINKTFINEVDAIEHLKNSLNREQNRTN